MLKYAIATTIFAVFSTTPAFADDVMKCDKASMLEIRKEIDVAVMKKRVDMANEELDMAKEAMKVSRMDECAIYLNSAVRELSVK